MWVTREREDHSRACPTGAAIRVSPEQFLNYAGPTE
jgi:hypothetical protein